MEHVIAERWLYETLSADGVLSAGLTGFYAQLAPEGAVSPYVVWQTYVDADYPTFNQTRVWADLGYVVKIIKEGSSGVSIEALAKQMDSLLHRVSGSTTGGNIVSCHRDLPFSFIETAEGKTYRHLGGVYRVKVQAT